MVHIEAFGIDGEVAVTLQRTEDDVALRGKTLERRAQHEQNGEKSAQVSVSEREH